MTDWVRIASTADVAPGKALGLEVMGLSLALCRVGEEWFCTDNICTHAFALLTDGWLDGHIIECPLHAGQFDVRTGAALGDPVQTDLRIFAVRIDGDDIMITLP